MRLLLLALLLSLAGCAESHPRDYALRLETSVGIFPIPSRVCSGTAVGPNVVLTADHCLTDATGLWIDGEHVQVHEVVVDGKDHALLRVERTFKQWARVRPGAREGGSVNWIGNPAGQKGVLRRGYVARVTADEIWMDAQAFGGDSGSGVFSRGGYLRMVLTGIRSWTDSYGNRMSVVVAFPLAFTAEQWQEIRN